MLYQHVSEVSYLYFIAILGFFAHACHIFVLYMSILILFISNVYLTYDNYMRVHS